MRKRMYGLPTEDGLFGRGLFPWGGSEGAHDPVRRRCWRSSFGRERERTISTGVYGLRTEGVVCSDGDFSPRGGRVRGFLLGVIEIARSQAVGKRSLRRSVGGFAGDECP
jgi:hypothetical protein